VLVCVGVCVCVFDNLIINNALMCVYVIDRVAIFERLADLG